MTGGEHSLLIALLASHGQDLLSLPGRTVNRSADGHRPEGATDVRDARVAGDQARMRRDLWPIRPGDEATIELKLPTGRRTDPVCDRTRAVNHPRGTPTCMFPGLERELDLGDAGPGLRLTGARKVRNAEPGCALSVN